MKRVLVLLSTYNGEKYLSDLILSLLSQKGVDLDILIRDDSSSDRTVELLEKIKDSRIKYYIGENKGAAQSFLDLIKNAPLQYDYYAFCDQDDVWKNDKIKIAVSKLNNVNDEKMALYYSGQIITDKNLNVLYEHKLDDKRSVQANCIFNQMAGCTAVFNRMLLIKMKEYLPKKIYGHDVWCYRLCAAMGGEIIVEKGGHILYRQHENNAVGLGFGIKNKLSRAVDYIFKYNASSYALEIMNGYGNQLNEKWKKFFEEICDNSLIGKWKILTNRSIIFHSYELRVLFVIKVLLGKL